MNGHNKSITQVNIDLRARPLTVDANDGSRKPIGACGDPVDTPIILDCLRERESTAGKKESYRF